MTKKSIKKKLLCFTHIQTPNTWASTQNILRGTYSYPANIPRGNKTVPHLTFMLLRWSWCPITDFVSPPSFMYLCCSVSKCSARKRNAENKNFFTISPLPRESETSAGSKKSHKRQSDSPQQSSWSRWVSTTRTELYPSRFFFFFLKIWCAKMEVE